MKVHDRMRIQRKIIRSSKKTEPLVMEKPKEEIKFSEELKEKEGAVVKQKGFAHRKTPLRYH